jgi:hypothetical protein
VPIIKSAGVLHFGSELRCDTVRHIDDVHRPEDHHETQSDGNGMRSNGDAAKKMASSISVA